MPQMNPMNWILLFMYFLLILKMFNMTIYFLTIKKPSLTNLNKIPQNYFNWKW
uniref:ATP synthase complex subunit 8 n=1 Tax=Lype phaeopa TaxID=623209 RepID=A0A7D6WFD3_9NEOP|nr:ATP synthase F0 subunit 8 [Lype phaeopa]